MLKINKLSYNSFKHRNICSHMLQVKETENCACSIERKPLTFVAILPNARKKVLNLAKILQHKLRQTFSTLARYKLGTLVKVSFYTATLLEDLFQNFG